MNIAPILPIAGTSEELLQAINTRFRQLSDSSASSDNSKPAGLFFLAANKPDANSTAIGTFGAETDTGIIWQVQTVGSSQVWVKVTCDNNLQIAYASGSLTLSTTHTDVTGATITLNKAGRYLITATCFLVGSGAGDIGQNLVGVLSADGSEQSHEAKFLVTLANCWATVGQQWSYSPAVSGKIVKLRGYKSGGVGSSTLAATDTSISALWVGP